MSRFERGGYPKDGPQMPGHILRAATEPGEQGRQPDHYVFTKILEVLGTGSETHLLEGRQTRVSVDAVDYTLPDPHAPLKENGKPPMKRYHARLVAYQQEFPETGLAPDTICGVILDETPDVKPDTDMGVFLTITREGMVNVNGRTTALDAEIGVSDEDRRKRDDETRGYIEQITGSIERVARNRIDTEKWRAQERRERLWRRVRMSGLVAGLCAAAISGYRVDVLGRIADVLPVEKPDKFDSHRYMLAGGTLLNIGDTKTPAPSKELGDREELSHDNMPSWNGSKDQHAKEIKIYDRDVNPGDGLRQVIITSSKPGHEGQCASVEVEGGVKTGTILRAWTDAVDQNGETIARNLEVEFTEGGKIIACWTKDEEYGPEQDPRVVFDIVAPPSNKTQK